MLTAARSTDGARGGRRVTRTREEEGRRGRCGCESGADVGGGKSDGCQLCLGMGGTGGGEGGRGGGGGEVRGERVGTTATVTGRGW